MHSIPSLVCCCYLLGSTICLHNYHCYYAIHVCCITHYQSMKGHYDVINDVNSVGTYTRRCVCCCVKRASFEHGTAGVCAVMRGGSSGEERERWRGQYIGKRRFLARTCKCNVGVFTYYRGQQIFRRNIDVLVYVQTTIGEHEDGLYICYVGPACVLYGNRYGACRPNAVRRLNVLSRHVLSPLSLLSIFHFFL